MIEIVQKRFRVAGKEIVVNQSDYVTDWHDKIKKGVVKAEIYPKEP